MYAWDRIATNMFKSINCVLIMNTAKNKNEKVSFTIIISSSDAKFIISIKKSVYIDSVRLLKALIEAPYLMWHITMKAENMIKNKIRKFKISDNAAWMVLNIIITLSKKKAKYFRSLTKSNKKLTAIICT